jgi:hypothetical protein
LDFFRLKSRDDYFLQEGCLSKAIAPSEINAIISVFKIEIIGQTEVQAPLF